MNIAGGVAAEAVRPGHLSAALFHAVIPELHIHFGNLVDMLRVDYNQDASDVVLCLY